MATQIRTRLAYMLLALGFVVTVPWCAGLAWFALRGLAELTGLLWAAV